MGCTEQRDLLDQREFTLHPGIGFMVEGIPRTGDNGTKARWWHLREEVRLPGSGLGNVSSATIIMDSLGR